MIAQLETGECDRGPWPAAQTAPADSPVPDDLQRVAAEPVVEAVQPDGHNLDLVEHARMMRLRSYQRQP